MNQYIADYLLFLAEAVTITAVFVVVIVTIAASARAGRGGNHDGRYEIRHLNARLRRTAESLNGVLLDRKALRRQRKVLRRKDKDRAKSGDEPARLFVLDFDGDLMASRVSGLREEISALLQVARDGDAVLLRLESGGGTVHGYGLAASQLRRLRERQIPLTVAIDKIAASGGYMMASVASHIIAAPFAIVGSIGVVAQFPNFNRLLKRNDIDFEMHTAGRYKRTLTLFGENTDEGRAKFREELEEAHQLFRNFIAEQRPALDLERVATGEHWFGSRALELGLVDELRTSDDYLLAQADTREVYELHYQPRRSLGERLSSGLAQLRSSIRLGTRLSALPR